MAAKYKPGSVTENGEYQQGGFLRVKRGGWANNTETSTGRGCLYLPLLPLLGEDVANQRILQNVLFDQVVPQAADGEGEVILCPATIIPYVKRITPLPHRPKHSSQ